MVEVRNAVRSEEGTTLYDLNMEESKIQSASNEVTERNQWAILSFIQEQMSCIIPRTSVVRSQDGRKVCIKKYHSCNFAESGLCDCLCDDILRSKCCSKQGRGRPDKRQTFSLSSENSDRYDDARIIIYYPCSCTSCCNCYWNTAMAENEAARNRTTTDRAPKISVCSCYCVKNCRSNCCPCRDSGTPAPPARSPVTVEPKGKAGTQSTVGVTIHEETSSASQATSEPEEGSDTNPTKGSS